MAQSGMSLIAQIDNRYVTNVGLSPTANINRRLLSHKIHGIIHLAI